MVTPNLEVDGAVFDYWYSLVKKGARPFSSCSFELYSIEIGLSNCVEEREMKV